jgi:hypothetical protein
MFLEVKLFITCKVSMVKILWWIWIDESMMLNQNSSYMFKTNIYIYIYIY